MESREINKINYDALSTGIMQLCTNINAFHQKCKDIAADYKQLELFLADKKFIHRFPNLDNEINDIIGKWNPTNPIGQLTVKLKDCLDKLFYIDNEITNIEKGKHNLLQLPDRHNRKAATDKIDVFLKNVTTISIAQMDRVKDEVIPMVIQMVKAVQDGFNTENRIVLDNKDEAESLLQRIDTYKSYVDKFGLFKTRTFAENVANEILKAPNYANPDSDKTKLQKANADLDRCDKSFEQEMDAFKQIGNKLNSTSNQLWLGDHEKIKQILNAGATQSHCSANELKSMYDDAVTQKKIDLLNFLNDYNKDIICFFKKEVDYITNHCINKEELGQLRKKIEAKIKGDKLKLYKKIAKIVAIVSAIIAFIVLMVVYWPWSGIVVGIIVTLIIYMIIKN